METETSVSQIQVKKRIRDVFTTVRENGWNSENRELFKILTRVYMQKKIPNFKKGMVPDNYLLKEECRKTPINELLIWDKILETETMKETISPEKITNTDYEKTNILYECIRFMDLYNPESVIISLSGGVDSMCLLFAWYKIFKRIGKPQNVIAVHIEYGNRQHESPIESQFLYHYCKQRFPEITFHLYIIDDFSRDMVERDLYEALTREIRFTCYKQWKNTPVILGHIRDDIYENIFLNISKQTTMENLNGMTGVDKQDGVDIWRPFLNISKQTIYNFAEMYKIPYFKDTTPDWSMRGKMRRQLFPLMQEIFGETILERYCSLSQKCQYLSDVHNSCIIEPLKEKIKVSEHYSSKQKQCVIPIPQFPISNESWEILIRHAYKKISKTHLSRKCLTPILTTLNRSSVIDCSTQMFTLTGGGKACVSYQEIILYDSVNAKQELHCS
tara:strand:+ start:1439 stop:2773 length:1335 start_codon:yes stop_codon:yes gene_type:complete